MAADADFQAILSYRTLSLYSDLDKLPEKVNWYTQETRSFRQ